MKGALTFIEKPWFQPPEYYKEQKIALKNKQATESAEKPDDIIDKPALDKERMRQLEEESQENFENVKRGKDAKQ